MISDHREIVGEIGHARQRSRVNVLVNLVASLTASCHQPRTPVLDVDPYRLPAA